MEEEMDNDPRARLREVIGPDRAEERIDADGEILWDEMTDEELDAIAGDGIEVGGRFIPWSKISDEQLRRIRDGEDPREVLQG